MRSKNLLPVQIVMPSNLMGGSQSMHKAAFEEALHNSIENSLRSPAVTPSPVFSSLFFTYHTSESTSDTSPDDVKPNADDIISLSSRRSTYDDENEPLGTPDVTAKASTPARPLAITSAESGPPALISVPSTQPLHRSLLNNQKNFSSENRTPASHPHSQTVLLVQQHQQFEQLKQARAEHLKNLQRLQAWQQMRKEQPNPRLMMGLPGMWDQNPAQHLTSSIRQPLIGNRPALPPIVQPHPTNGISSNESLHSNRVATRQEQPQVINNPQGFCKSGNDIRLSTLENDCTRIVPFPKDFSLLALQPSVAGGDNTIVVAINLQMLPQTNSSSQALSVQCVGCGEKSLRFFSQLAAHVGIELKIDPVNTRLNSGQLLGACARFCLFRDLSNPQKLVRGPPMLWYKHSEGWQRTDVSIPRPTVPAIRGNFSVASTSQPAAVMPAQMQDVMPGSVQMPPTSSGHPVTSGRLNLRRTLSGPIQNKLIEPAKRQVSSLSQDEIVEISDDPPPKRYSLNQNEILHTVDICDDYTSTVQRKPVIAFLYPLACLPRFSGDTSSVVMTLRFSHCFKEPSPSVRKDLSISENSSSLCSKHMFLVTVQYLSSLGAHKLLTVEGFSYAVLRAKQFLTEEPASALKDMKISEVIGLAKMAAAVSNGSVEIIHNKISVASGISECLKQMHRSSCLYFVIIHFNKDNDEDLQFHLLVADKQCCRLLGEELHSSSERSSLINEGLVSVAFTKLRLSFSIADMPIFLLSAPSTSKYAPPRNHSSVDLSYECPQMEASVSSTAALLLTKVENLFGEHQICDLSDFTSLRFIFLVPPSTPSVARAVQAISNSGVLSDLYKTALPSSGMSSQVVVTMETSSVQRISSLCKQWDSSSTLLVLIQLDAHSTLSSIDAFDCLNCSSVASSKNVLFVQCSSSPYMLLTDTSRISSSNVVYDDSNCETNDSTTSLYLGTSSACFMPFSTVYDPVYEEQKDDLFRSYHTLHSALVACELLTQQYVTSLVMSSALEMRNRKGYRAKKPLPSLVNQVMQELIDSRNSHLGDMVLVRISSPLLATRFYDTIKQTRDKLNLEKAFEVVLYDDVSHPISLSTYFLQMLQTRINTNCDWQPTSLLDLCGIPCFVIYEGYDIICQPMPRTLKYVDLRMAFEGIGVLYRSTIEQEMSLAAGICCRGSGENQKELAKRDEKMSSDEDDDRLQVVEMDDQCKIPDSSPFAWQETKKDSNFSCNSISKTDETFNKPQIDKVSLDFVSLAMKQANLPAGQNDNAKNFSATNHASPLAILPSRIYNLVNHVPDRNSMLEIPPHSLCQWNAPLHPLPPFHGSPKEIASFYSQWTSPVEGNPDCSNGDHVVDKKRILLVSPPNSNSAAICCHFIQLLHRKLLSMQEIHVYDDPEYFSGEIHEGSFRVVIPNSLRRGLSQLTNSFNKSDEVANYIDKGTGTPERQISTKVSQHTLSCVRQGCKRELQAQDSKWKSSLYTLKCVADVGNSKTTLYYRIVIPTSHLNEFKYSAADDGSFELRTLLLKEKVDWGIKTPVISIATHGIDHGLYNFPSDSHELVHLVVVKSCDAESYTNALPNHVIVVLSPDFDHLGKGAMKYATQVLLQHFYETECESVTKSEIWPFVLLLDDDVVTLSKWQPRDLGDADSVVTQSFKDISLREVFEIIEPILTGDIGAVGFRPWSSRLKLSPSQKQVILSEGYLLECGILESCMFINLKLTKSIPYSRSSFENETIDWSLRAAASGLNLIRCENIAMVTKVMPIPKLHVELANKESLVAVADSDFQPLYFHPALLLERHMERCATALFPAATGNSRNPVLCVDCYFSLGPEICVQFASTEDNVPFWAFDYTKEYGGLLLSCPNCSVRPELLQRFKFVEGSTVCVMGSDRSSLRQTIVNLSLETTWHFRLTNEFQTANHINIGSSQVRPFYFLTGVKKVSNHV